MQKETHSKNYVLYKKNYMHVEACCIRLYPEKDIICIEIRDLLDT